MILGNLFGLAPLAIGIAIIVAARPLATGMVRWAEWQLNLMRRPWFAWYYRCFGLVFAIVGLGILFQSRPE